MTDETILTAPDGTEYEIEVSNKGLQVILRSGGRLLINPTNGSNVVQVVPWPTFQPVVPPTAEQPVQVSRSLVSRVMAPKHNGVGHEAVEAVQAAVDAEPAFRVMLDGIILSTLIKKDYGAGYESVEVR